MVTRSHLQLVQTETAALQAWRARLAAAAGPQNALIERALDFAAPLYENRVLGGDRPLLAHVLDVAQTLSALNLDADTLAAALLYPAYERSPDTARAIREKFGVAIADLAEGVVRMAHIGALSTRSGAAGKPQQQAAQLESLRKMLLAMVQDVRVVLIKLSDHLQDLRAAIKSEDEASKRAVGELTRDIFAPLANRLGVWQLKWELEDLAFRLLEPVTYKEIAKLLDEKRLDRERYIEAVIATLKGELARAGVAAEVTGRPKHIYSIYKKMQRKGVGFEALFDVRAVRVLVDDVKDCYAALGLVHHLWSPIPKEFDDYIAKPKANQYRSLHTAVIGPEGKAIEVQIRTQEMHQHSELGIAAHWRYKESGRHERGYDEKIAWLRQILEWKDEVSDASELAEQFKTELFADTVYVLTPQGRVIDLPKGSTPIDFAYHVHTELGHRCRGAKVDGAMVPLNTPLANGQQVEILAAKQGGPSRDWLNPALGFLRSQGARSKVRNWFNRQNLEADLAQGRAMLDKELQRHGMTALNLDKLAADMGFEKLPDLLVDIARGAVGPKQMQDALKPPEPQIEPEETIAVPKKPRSSGKGSVLVVGVDKLLTLTAKCCKPAPPDRIVGFVTRGRGVSVHRADCANVKRLDNERCVAAEWGDASGATFPVDVAVEALDRTGLLRDISDVLTREHVNVTATSTQTTAHIARMRFTCEVANLDQLSRVLTLVRDVKGVMSAERR
ncbi:MAG TPA: bifunctional (p)ppGpp synthetase/guanosine-3',5'-bis(diphosphate) 3'-pyrophosphohydrolase [Burkholderiales bacterium]|nr:bifunctional (p)ppGpp synthetase/guanosine-3',5'-bis(diphosphate) 3'-pyrophosphohydrolase [Burkholderiales bacterium]